MGVNLSANNVAYLQRTFQDQRCKFLQGDIEKLESSSHFDLLISSLVMKDLFPTFEKALTNISRFMRNKSLMIFDLRERQECPGRT